MGPSASPSLVERQKGYSFPFFPHESLPFSGYFFPCLWKYNEIKILLYSLYNGNHDSLFFFFWFSRNIQSPLLNVSHKVFAEIGKPDKVALTAMLAGYAMHGQGKEAIEFFQRTVLEGMKPDHVTFALLSACSHSGLVKEGKYYFQIMSDIYGVKPQLDHY